MTEEVVLRVESSDGCCFVASDTTSVGVARRRRVDGTSRAGMGALKNSIWWEREVHPELKLTRQRRTKDELDLGGKRRRPAC